MTPTTNLVLAGCESRRLMFSVVPPIGRCCRCCHAKILASKPKLMGRKRPRRPRGVEELVSFWAWLSVPIVQYNIWYSVIPVRHL